MPDEAYPIDIHNNTGNIKLQKKTSVGKYYILNSMADFEHTVGVLSWTIENEFSILSSFIKYVRFLSVTSNTIQDSKKKNITYSTF